MSIKQKKTEKEYENNKKAELKRCMEKLIPIKQDPFKQA